ncbi:putative membrane protein YphA (DoxX/SURF4 family) [Bradyrhizobium sp. AZCC 1610]|uniref:hypothetical protein n=1 Tax=Bradyrhizobium sp. AZCC 1610 TaxID=3117020 RepID=UPI002FF04E6F
MMEDLAFVAALGSLTIKLLFLTGGALAIAAATILALNWMASASDHPPWNER